MADYIPTDFEGLDAGHRAVVRNNTLSRDSRLLFVILNSFASTKDGCYITNGRLALYLNCTGRSIQKWIDELKAAGAITVHLVDKNKREIKIISKIQIRKKESHEQPCTGVCSNVPGGTNAHSGGYEPAFTQGSRLREVEKGSRLKVRQPKKEYPYIAQAVKAEGSEAQRTEFFSKFKKYMKYYNDSQPTVAQMLLKLQQEIDDQKLRRTFQCVK